MNQFRFTGYTAGGGFHDVGGGAGLLCLPDHPTWGSYTDGLNGYKGYIYGVEIDMLEPSHAFNHAVNQQDQPCVVCHSSFDCFPGWSLQYAGYLMSSKPNSNIKIHLIEGSFHEVSSMTREAGFTSMGSPRNLL